VNATAWSWESASTWKRFDGSPGVVPGASDDVVFVRKSCSAGKNDQLRWSLTLQSDVTVRSVTFSSFGYCLTSFVVGPTGALRVQRFTASNATRVFLQNGSITAPTLLFDTFSFLGGAGTITGEVVLTGQSTLFAGGASLVRNPVWLIIFFLVGAAGVGAGCWPGLVALDGGTLRIDTLRVGPAVIQGGLPPDGSARRRGIAAGSAVVGRLVVSAGTVTRLVFLADGIFLRYNQLEVIRVVNFFILS
jgi:hypothetical protein